MAAAGAIDTIEGTDGHDDTLTTADPTDNQTNGVEHENARPRFVLSRREVQVLRLAADGLEHSEIGLQLLIANATVRNHMVNIRRKLGARNTVHALAIALRKKLLTID